MPRPDPVVWSTFSADPRLTDSADLRATDGDRQIAASALGDAFADGRLTRVEHDERLDAALQAVRLGQLAGLLADLVPLTPARAVGAAADRSVAGIRYEAERKYARDLRDARNGWVFVSVLTNAIWIATSIAGGGLYFYWPVFPMIGVGIGWFSTRLNRDERIEGIEERLAERQRTLRGSQDH